MIMQRYLTAVVPGVVATFALLLAMQGLIASGDDVLLPPQPERFSLQFVRTIKDKPVDVIDPVEPIDPPVPLPPPIIRDTGIDDGPGIPVRGFAPIPTPPDSRGSDIFRMSDGPLVYVIRVKPDYPARALRLGIEGFVTVRFDVGIDGRVSNLSIIQSTHQLLDEAAKKAAKKFRFKPRVVDGSPVTVSGIRYRFRFGIDK